MAVAREVSPRDAAATCAVIARPTAAMLHGLPSAVESAINPFGLVLSFSKYANASARSWVTISCSLRAA